MHEPRSALAVVRDGGGKARRISSSYCNVCRVLFLGDGEGGGGGGGGTYLRGGGGGNAFRWLSGAIDIGSVLDNIKLSPSLKDWWAAISNTI